MPRCSSPNGRHTWLRYEDGGLRGRTCADCGIVGVMWPNGCVYPPDFKREQPAKNYTSRRSRGTPRAVTLSTKILTRRPELQPEIEPNSDRPKTRGDCADVIRPCPWVSCRYNLYLDINPATGSIKLNFPALEPSDLEDTCALDVAERGGLTLEEMSYRLNITRERSRQLEARALLTLKWNGKALGLDAEAIAAFAHPPGNHEPTIPTQREESAKKARAAYKDRQRALIEAAKARHAKKGDSNES
jgi:hypothetical protein